MTGRYKVQFNGGKIRVETTQSSDNINKLSGSIRRNDYQIEFVPESVDTKFHDFFSEFKDRILGMSLSKKNTNEIFDLFGKLTEENTKLCVRFLEIDDKKSADAVDTLTKTQNYILKAINSVKTDYLRNKQFKKNPLYVSPIQKALGLVWKTKTKPEIDVPDHQLAQTTYQIVPISETIKALFSNCDFESLFIAHNNNKY